ncbi:hypothetical protein D3C83_192120 [compost metagenome]
MTLELLAGVLELLLRAEQLAGDLLVGLRHQLQEGAHLVRVVAPPPARGKLVLLDVERGEPHGLIFMGVALF